MTTRKMERVSAREKWPREDADFTPWLARAEHLTLVEEAIGRPLEVLQTEARVGPYRLDMLCRDAETDALVAVENQLEPSDHRHLGQLLTYSAGLGADVVVWITTGFSPPHLRALDRLNRISGDAYRFFGLRLELWRADGEELAPLLVPVVRPDQPLEEVESLLADEPRRRRGGRAPRGMQRLSPWNERRLAFWRGLGDYLREQGARFRAPDVRQPTDPARWSLGRPGVELRCTVKQKGLTVFVYIASKAHPTWYGQLYAQRAEIDAELRIEGESGWNESPGTDHSTIYAFKPLRLRGEVPDDAFREGFAWMLDTLDRFDRALRQRVVGLRD